MIDKKKVMLLGTAVIVTIGCCVYATSGDKSSFKMVSKRGFDFKEKFSNAQDFKLEEISGDSIKKFERKSVCKDKDQSKISNKEKYENLSEEEKEALKEKREAKKEERAKSKENFKSLSEEEKAKAKEKFENLSEEEKSALKEHKFKRKNFKNKNIEDTQESDA